MKKRIKRNIYEGVVKTAVIKTIKNVLIFDVLAILFCYAVSIYILNSENITIFIVLIIVFSAVYCIIAINNEVKIQKRKIIRKIVDKTLPINTSVQVFPKPGHFKQKKFFEKEIPKITGKYYAILTKESNLIQICLKFNAYNAILLLEEVSKEEFLTGYEIIKHK